LPLYVLLLLVTVSIHTQMGRPMPLSLLALNLTLLKGFSEKYKFSGLAQTWSLTVELCFYGVAPLLFLALRRWGSIVVTLGLIGIGLLLWASLGQLAWLGVFSPRSFVLFYTFWGRSFEFVAGMWLARQWYQNTLPTRRQSTSTGLLLLTGCITCRAGLLMFITSPNRLFWSEVILYNGLLPLGISLFLMGLLTQHSRVRQFLSLPIMQELGKSPYAFFLVHIGVLASGLQKLGVVNRGVLFILLIGIGYGLCRFIENPLTKWLRA
jgi:peptidoglycan/LPS O-acetylase OafA/YrhL